MQLPPQDRPGVPGGLPRLPPPTTRAGPGTGQPRREAADEDGLQVPERPDQVPAEGVVVLPPPVGPPRVRLSAQLCAVLPHQGEGLSGRAAALAVRDPAVRPGGEGVGGH